jgi:hypothetical protein
LRCPGWLLECEVRRVALGSDVQKTLPESFLLQELGVFKRVLKRVLKKVLEDVDARETRAVGCQKELSGCVEVVHYIMIIFASSCLAEQQRQRYDSITVSERGCIKRA